MASSSRTDSWPRNGATTSESNTNQHNYGGVDHNQNKRNNHKSNAVERKHSDKDDPVKMELAKLKNDWNRLQQENTVRPSTTFSTIRTILYYVINACVSSNLYTLLCVEAR